MRIIRILLAVIVVILLITSVLFLLFGGKKDTNKTSTTAPSGLMGAANTDATVSFTNDGIINGSEMHRQIKITVSKTTRTLTVIEGYQGMVLTTNSFVNNQPAFESFLSAINGAGFAKERTNPTSTNIAGYCPLGNRYIYSSTDIADIPNNLWTSTCGTKSGTFGGNAATTNKLFQLQIPNYSTLVSQVKLN